jgi:hypothetical protein
MPVIPIIIPTGTQHTTTVMGYIARQVTCEECHERYLYDAQREAVGVSHTELFGNKAAGASRSQSWASRALHGTLQRAIELVPCPSCGHYQSDAVRASRKVLWTPVKQLSVTAFVLGITFAAIAAFFLYRHNNRNFFVMATVAACTLTVGLVLWAIRKLRVAHYDPNTENRETRIAAGRHRAYRPEDMNVLLKARQTGAAVWHLNRRKTKIATIWIFVGLPPLLLSLGMGFFIRNELIYALESPAWPQAPGTITRSAKIVSSRGGICSDVRYTFSANGSEYTSDRLWFGPNQDAAANLSRYPVDTKVTVSYHPANPAVSVLYPGFKWPESYMKPGYVLVGLAVSSCILGIGIVLMWSWRRELRDFNYRKPTWRESNEPVAPWWTGKQSLLSSPDKF